MTQILLLMVATVILWGIYQYGARLLTCPYCGEKAGHGQDCPYDTSQRH